MQLGQEITDDSVFALQSEDRSRLELIDDLRKLVKSQNNNPEVTKTVNEFVKYERECNAEYLVIALGAWISEDLQSSMTEVTDTHHNAIIEGGAVRYQDEVKKFSLSKEDDIVKVGAATIDFEASQPNSDAANQGIITISAVARGHVAFPIAEFFSETSEMRLIGVDHLSHGDRYKIMLAIVTMLDVSDKPEFNAAIGSKEITPRQFLIEAFGLNEKIDERLRPTDEAQEKLARTIGKKRLNIGYRGVAQNVSIGMTHGSVSGWIELRRVNEALEAHVFAKPEKRHGVPTSEIATFVYDVTLPFTTNFPKGEDAVEFQALIEKFFHIDASHA